MALYSRLCPAALCGVLSLLTYSCESADPKAEPDGTSGDSSTAPNTGGTGGDSTSPEPDSKIPGLEERRSTLSRVKPEVSAQDKATLRDGNLDLSFELLRNSGKEAKENVAVSAVSVRSAFGMLHAMARGETQSQIAAELGLLADADKTQAGINHIDQTLKSRNLEKSEEDAAVVLSTGNRIFARKGLTPSSEFLDTLAQNYGAGIYQTDFAGKPEASRKAINKWVGKQTFDKIPELLPPGSIASNTVWVFTNAMYFRAPWTEPFDLSRPMDFTRLDDSVASVPTMYGGEISANYGTQSDFEWAQIPLRGGSLSALVIVPNAGKYKEVESAMSAQLVNKMIAEQKEGQLEVYLPKFKIETGSMSYTKFFSDKLPLSFGAADFSGFGGDAAPTPLTSVYHSVFLATDEIGVEAAAATAGESEESGSVTEFSLKANRPFLFLVYDQPSGLVLFSGRVMDPSA